MAQPYITVDDLVERQTSTKLKRILDIDDNANLNENPVILASVGDANSDAETYIRRQIVDFPINSTPEILKRHVCVLAMYYLCDYKEQNWSDIDQRRLDATREWLEKVGTGEIHLEFESNRNTMADLQPITVQMTVPPRENPYGVY